MSLSSLFEPFSYKKLNLKNRFVMAPMTRTQSPQGIPTDEVVAYYERRAAAEVGLILSEGTVINRIGSKNHFDIPDFHGDQALGAWQKVINAVHDKGGAMAPQIWHVGNVNYLGQDFGIKLEGPDSMSLEDIHDTIKQYAEAATAAKNLGFDALELHGAHGYLIDQFFWAETNKRTDEYGGSTIKERSKFAVDVVKAVRAAVGEDFTIILRLSQWKQQEYTARLANTPEEMEQWLQPLADAGVDIFHCSTRRFWEPEFEKSDMNFAGWAKKITGQPTITVGSVGLSGDFMAAFSGEGSDSTNNLSDLVKMYDRGDFDLVAVGRALLKDPQWVKKVKEERLGELQDFDSSSLAVYY